MTEAEELKLRLEYLEAENENLLLRLKNQMWWQVNKDKEEEKEATCNAK